MHHSVLSLTMQRRSRSRMAGQVPLVPSSAYPSHSKQSQARVAATTNSKRDLYKLYDDLNDLVEDNDMRVVDPTTPYSEELMDAFKRKSQELCDETREQYEQKLERREAQHERQVQNLQRQLREVVGTCVSLAEHEQILATAAKEHQRQLEELRMRHYSELRELEQQCERKWQTNMMTAREQSEQEKAALMQRIEQLKLRKSEAAAEAKECELTELRWGEKLEAAGRATEAVERRLEDTKKRLEDACRIIVSLKTRLRHHAKVLTALECQRDKTTEVRDEVMKWKISYAELKGDHDTRVATLERELEHTQRVNVDEKAKTCTLQTEVGRLREELQHQQCCTVELAAKGKLSDKHHAAERKQLQKELQVEKQVVKDTVTRLDEMRQQAAKAQLQHETLVQDQRTRLELQLKTEASLKRQLQRLKQRVEQFKIVMEKLYAENKQLGEEVNNRDASTEAWAKKLFGK